MSGSLAHETLGLVCSLACALCWAIAVVLFKKSGDAMGPLALNLFKNVLALVLLGATGFVLGFQRGAMSDADLVWLLLSGALGIGVADSLLFYGLNQIGASRQAIVDTLYSPSVVVLSFLFLHEVLSPRDALGGLLILGAVALATIPVGGGLPLARTKMARGIAAGALSMVLMAAAIVFVKPILEHNDVVTCTTIRLLGGTVSLALFGLTSRANRRELAATFVPRPAWRFAVPGAIMGTYVSMLLWIGAFKYAPAGVAALLNQTSTLFIVILAAVFLRERPSPRVLAAVALASAGTLLVLS
jgi:drug/metabolite transporter (DMT)-like permease